MDHFGVREAVWNAAKAEIRAVLIDCARRGAFIAYSDLVRRVGALDLQARDPRLDALLEELSTAEAEAGRGMLSVLVVHKSGDQRPGGGFFALAERLQRDTSDRDRLWVEEFRKVCVVWAS